MKRINPVLVFAVLLSAITIVACNPKKEKKRENENSVTEDTESKFEDDVVYVVSDTTETDDDAAETDTTEISEETESEPVMVENEDGSVRKVPDEEIEKEKKAPKKKHVKKFYIVAGSFQNINNAVTLRKFFKKRGYPAMILYPYHGYNRVATGSFPNRASAEKEIKKFRNMKLSYEGEKIEYWLLWR